MEKNCLKSFFRKAKKFQFSITLLPIELGKALNEVFAKRQFGDYDVDADISEKEVKEVIENAKMFVNEIKSFLMAH